MVCELDFASRLPAATARFGLTLAPLTPQSELRLTVILISPSSWYISGFLKTNKFGTRPTVAFEMVSVRSSVDHQGQPSG